MPPSPPSPTLPPLSRDDAPTPEEEAFDAFARDQDPVDLEAATWATRRRGGLDAQAEAAMQQWLAQDPRHAEALAEMDALLGDVQQLPDDEVATLRGAHAGPLTGSRPPDRSRPAGRRRLLPQASAAALAFAVVGAGWMGWDHWRQQAVFDRVYASPRGEQRIVRLPDAGDTPTELGSQVTLDTASRAEVTLYRDRRELRLTEGQAMFTVQADASRPFHVYAGGLHITVVGTRFSVRHSHTGVDAGRTVVAVEEGQVRVAAQAGVGPATATSSIPAVRLLGAGQMVSADAQGQLGQIGSLPPSSVGAWRDGRLNFERTPLAQAIAEFERYGPTRLTVRDPALARLPVGGSYGVGQWRQFADGLPQVLPVRLLQRGDMLEVVAR